MSLQGNNLEELRKFIRNIVIKELNEASQTGDIDGGEGPPSTPYWINGKERKKKIKKAGYGGGHKKPTVLGYMLAIDPKLRKVY